MTLTFDSHRKLDLIAMGRVAVDLYAEQIGADLADAQSFRKYLGGCAGNIAVGSARLSLRSSMLSCVGDDKMGEFVQKTLRHEGVDISALQVSRKNLTGLVVLGVCPPDNFPLIFYRNDCADMAIDENLITEEYLASSKALLITGTGLSHEKTRRATMHAVHLAKKVSTKIILDIDYRPVLWGLLNPGDGENRYVENKLVSETFAAILPLVDLVVGTEEECRIAGGNDDFSAAIYAIRRSSSATIVVKKGINGADAYVNCQDKPVHGTSFPVTVVNVLGAGDGFMAGLLSSLLKNAPMSDALTRANACGAIVVARHGCSPATPSTEELEYFLSHYSSDKDVLTKPVITQMHQRALLKNSARTFPMPIFAFCHRWQLEEVCKKFNQPFEIISTFKTTLAEAFVECCKRHGITNPFILVDPIYGQGAQQYGQRSNIKTIVAIEKSGAQQTEWVQPVSAYELLHERSPTLGVKILWQFHTNLSADVYAHQIGKLQELAHACEQLDRKLMLELIISPHLAQGDYDVINAVERVYREGIYPYWWKLAGLSSRDSFKQLGGVIDEFDRDARVVILGGEQKNLSQFGVDFANAKSTHHTIGFAVGRNIFWPSFMAYVEGSSSLTDVKHDVINRFFALYQLFLKA